MDIQSGAGGEEACDFVGMLSRMYQRWATKHDYKLMIVDEVPGDKGELKSISLHINSPQVYGWLRQESGVHRLTRVSPFDSSSRRQTSFASVTVQPDYSRSQQLLGDFRLSMSDIRVEVMRAGGCGGQHINKTESAVRFTHRPTGTVVKCSESRSQIDNRKTAMHILTSRVYQLQQDRLMEARDAKYADLRKTRIQFGSQTRTYSFCGFIGAKDSRSGLVVNDINGVFDGNIDSFMLAALKMRARERHSDGQ